MEEDTADKIFPWAMSIFGIVFIVGFIGMLLFTMHFQDKREERIFHLKKALEVIDKKEEIRKNQCKDYCRSVYNYCFGVLNPNTGGQCECYVPGESKKIRCK